MFILKKSLALLAFIVKEIQYTGLSTLFLIAQH